MYALCICHLSSVCLFQLYLLWFGAALVANKGIHDDFVSVCVLYDSGQSPADAELNYIDNAKKLAMYGVHLHEAKVLSLSLSLSLPKLRHICLSVAV